MSHSTEMAATRLRAMINELGGTILADTNTEIVASFGSRLAYRILGVMRPSTFPFRVTLRLTKQGEGTAIAAQGEDNGGKAAVYFSPYHRAFRRYFERACEKLRSSS